MQKGRIHLDVRTEQVVLDESLNTVHTGLEELSSLESSPDLDHGKINSSTSKSASTALSTQLSEDGKSSATQVLATTDGEMIKHIAWKAKG